MARSHAEARTILDTAFREEFGRAPTLAERQALQTVALAETSYAQGWDTAEKRAAENWGAIIKVACKPGVMPDCPPGSFLSRDSYPDGSPCWQCFAKNASPEAGARHLVRTLYKGRRDVVLRAARSGSIRAISIAMYDTGYYTGIGATREARIDRHEKWLRSHYDRIIAGLGERRALNGRAKTSVRTVEVGLAVLGLLTAVIGLHR